MTAAKDTESPHITQQYRDHDKMVYELRAGTSAIVMLSSRNEEGHGEWRFEAHPMGAPQLVVMGEWGATRADAFRNVRDVWIERGEAGGFARYDWEKVAAALTAVRGI